MQFKKSLMCIALSLTIGLNGCANVYYTDADESLKQNEPATFKTSGLQACGIFAVAFAAICLSTDSRTCIILPALGCTLGYTADYLLDKLREDYAKDEDRLDALYKIVDNDFKGTKTLTNLLKENLNKDKEELDRLEREYIRTKYEDYEDYVKAYNRVINNINYVEERLKAERKIINVTYGAYKQLGNDYADKESVQKEKARLNKKISEASKEYEDLIKMISDYADATCMNRTFDKKDLAIALPLNMPYNKDKLEREKEDLRKNAELLKLRKQLHNH